MSDYRSELERWQNAGVIDAATAARIRDFESRRSKRGEDRPGVSEALAYVGIAAVGVGAIVLGGLLWEDLTTPARFLAMFVPGVVALLFGWLMIRTRQPSLERGGGVAWAIAVPLLAGAVAVLLDARDIDDERVFLGMAVAAVLVAGATWLLAPAHPQVIALAASIGALVIGVTMEAESGDSIGPGSALAFAATLTIVVAVAWLAVTEAGWMHPEASARVMGAFAVATAAYIGSFDGDFRAAFEAAVILIGAALIGLSVLRGAFVYMAFGVITLFLGIITIIMRRVPDPVTGAIVIMVAGVMLIGVVLLLARWKPWRQEAAAP